MPRLATLMVVLSILATSCYEQKRYHLPYSSPDIATGGPCVQQCENQAAFAKADVREDTIIECVAKCPGIQVEDGTCGPQHQVPYGYCRSRDETDEDAAFGGKIALQIVGGVLLLIGVIWLVEWETERRAGEESN